MIVGSPLGARRGGDMIVPGVLGFMSGSTEIIRCIHLDAVLGTVDTLEGLLEVADTLAATLSTIDNLAATLSITDALEARLDTSDALASTVGEEC